MKHLLNYRIFEQEIKDDYGEGDPPTPYNAGLTQTPRSVMDEDPIIQKIQAGDFDGAKKMVKELVALLSTSDEKDEINARISMVANYIKDLPAEKRDEIRQALNTTQTTPGLSAVTPNMTA
jgi:predicted transcriptional regulator